MHTTTSMGGQKKSPDDPWFGFPTPLAGFGFPASNRRGLLSGYSRRGRTQEKSVTKTQQFSMLPHNPNVMSEGGGAVSLSPLPTRHCVETQLGHSATTHWFSQRGSLQTLGESLQPLKTAAPSLIQKAHRWRRDRMSQKIAATAPASGASASNTRLSWRGPIVPRDQTKTTTCTSRPTSTIASATATP